VRALLRVALGALFLVLATPSADAGEWRAWCGEDLGWHFYCDRDDAPDESPSQIPPEVAPPSAHARILEIRRELEEARATAILEPSPAHVTAYLRLQQAALQKSAAFSDSFRRVVWATPELDYTLRRPVGALAKHLWSDERRAARDTALARLGERYGLIYLGDPACAACRVFGPLFRAFALRHGLDVLAVSMTGGALEGWPEAVPDHGQVERLGLAGSPLPAIVLFDTETQLVLPVSFGVLAEDQLAERIFVLTSLEAGHDF